MNRIWLLISFFVVFIFGCASNEKKVNVVAVEKALPNPRISIVGNWRLADVKLANKSKAEDDLLNEANGKKIVQFGLLYSFYPDSSFTSFSGTGEYDFGSWKFTSSKKEILISSKKVKDTFAVKPQYTNDRAFLYLQNKKTRAQMRFASAGMVNGEFLKDPFLKENNTWRIKPAKAESNEQLLDRLGNYIKHLAYILKAGTDQKRQAVSFEFSEGLIKIYNGGIGIKPLDEVPLTWVSTYYSDEQALTAYKMFEGYLITSKSYKGGTTGEWYVDDYNILLSIYGDLKDGKFPMPGIKK